MRETLARMFSGRPASGRASVPASRENLALVALLERPSALNHVLFFAAFGLAYLTRSQAIVVAAAAVTAPILFALFQRGAFRATMWAYRWLYATFIGGAVLVVAALLAVRFV